MLCVLAPLLNTINLLMCVSSFRRYVLADLLLLLYSSLWAQGSVRVHHSVMIIFGVGILDILSHPAPHTRIGYIFSSMTVWY